MEAETRTRLPRFRRHRFTKPSFILQERDREIVGLVADYRVISSEEIQALVDGSDQMILRRLQKLYHAGYLDRPRRQVARGNGKLVYALGQQGAKLLAERFGEAPSRDWSEENRQLTLQFLEHTLMVSRFRAIMTLACRNRTDVELAGWRQGRELWDEVTIEHADSRERIPVCPDSYFVLRLVNEAEGRNRIHVFLEADRSTMTVKRFLSKIRGYWHYWRSDRPAERYGIRNFLVLTTTPSEERARNLCMAAREIDAPQHRGLRMFLFGTVRACPLDDPGRTLDRIWLTAGDEGRHSLLE